jgi:hypothetical protein
VIGYYATYLFRRYWPERVRYDALTHLAVTRVVPDDAGGVVADFGREAKPAWHWSTTWCNGPMPPARAPC